MTDSPKPANELLPCPFCGVKPSMGVLMNGSSFWVYCANDEYDEYDNLKEESCPVRPEVIELRDTWEAAAALWNTRATIESERQTLPYADAEDADVWAACDKQYEGKTEPTPLESMYFRTGFYEGESFALRQMRTIESERERGLVEALREIYATASRIATVRSAGAIKDVIEDISMRADAKLIMERVSALLASSESGGEVMENKTAANCAHWTDGRCESCGVAWQVYEVSEAFKCPHFTERKANP
jgi:hypothetical protein